MPLMGVLPGTVRSQCLCLILSGNAVHPGPHRRRRTAYLGGTTAQGWGWSPSDLPPAGPWLPPLVPCGSVMAHSGYWCDEGCQALAASPLCCTEGAGAAVTSSQHSWGRGNPEPNLALNVLSTCARQWRTGRRSAAPPALCPDLEQGRGPMGGRDHHSLSAPLVQAAPGPQTPGKGQKQALGWGAVHVSLHRLSGPMGTLPGLRCSGALPRCQAWCPWRQVLERLQSPVFLPAPSLPACPLPPLQPSPRVRERWELPLSQAWNQNRAHLALPKPLSPWQSCQDVERIQAVGLRWDKD